MTNTTPAVSSIGNSDFGKPMLIYALLIAATIASAVPTVGLNAALAKSLPRPELAAAKAYVDQIYRAIPGGKFQYRDVRYAPALKRLIAKDDAASQGEVGAIDAVPFCDCQDTVESYRFTTKVTASGPNGAVATVILNNPDARTFRIDMTRTAAGWTVADIHSPSRPSLVTYLHKTYP